MYLQSASEYPTEQVSVIVTGKIIASTNFKSVFGERISNGTVCMALPCGLDRIPSASTIQNSSEPFMPRKMPGQRYHLLPPVIWDFFFTRHNQSEMYKPNDVLIKGVRLSNLFNIQNNDFHDKYINPIRGLWMLKEVLSMESLIDETLNKFTTKLGAKFADTGNHCMMDEWLGYCKNRKDLFHSN